MSDTDQNAEPGQPTPGATSYTTTDGFGMEAAPTPTAETDTEVARSVAILERAKAHGGVDPVTGRSVQDSQQYLRDIANGLVDVEGPEMTKAAAVCRRLGIEVG